MAQEQLLQIFGALKNLEVSVSNLYGSFSEKTEGEDKTFWESLRKAELTHVKHINTIMEYITNNPDSFITGRPVTLKAISMVTDAMKRHTIRTQSGEISPSKFTPLALDVECSLLENKFHEIAKTADPRFNALTTIIMADTRAHVEMIKNRKIT